MTNSYSNNHMSLNSNLVKCYVSSLNRINNSFPFTVAYQKDTDGFCYKSYESYENFIETCFNKEDNPEMHRWNEVVLEDRQIIEFYDLDGKLGSELFNYCKENGEDNTIKEFLSARKVFIRRYFPKYNVKEEKIAISTAYNDTKFSVHITIRNGFYFKNAYTLKTFCLKFQEYLKDTPFTIDMNPYKKNTNFRMLYNTKVGQNRYLKKHHLSTDIPDKDFLISYIKPEDVLFELEETTKPKNFIKKEKTCDIGKDNQEMTQLLNLINSDCDDDLWRGVAQSIYNLTEGSEDGLEKFIEWSKKDGFIDFNENKCIDKWDKLRNSSDWNGLDYLKGKAKKENPEQYYEIYEKKNDQDYSPKIVFIDDDDEIGIDDNIDNDYCWTDFEIERKEVFDDYYELMKFFKLKFPLVCKKINLGKGVYLKNEYNELKYNPVPCYDLNKNTKFYYNTVSKKADTITKTTTTLEHLFEDSKLPSYSRLVCKPTNIINKYELNIWEKFKADIKLDYDIIKLQPLLDYMLEIICDNQKNLYTYLISWLRHICKNPEKKTGKVLVFQSDKQRAGKGSFINWLMFQFFGKNSSYTTSLVKLTGKFNSFLMNRSLITVDELPTTSARFHSVFDTLKSLITEPYLDIEFKGKESIQTDNICNFIFSTNNEKSIKIENYDDRYVCFKINECKVGDYEFWEYAHKNIFTEDVAIHFFNYLMNIDTSQLVSISKIPETELKTKMKEMSLNSMEIFIQNLKDRSIDDFDIDNLLNTDIIKQKNAYGNEFVLLENIDINTKLRFKKQAFYDLYVRWCSKCGETPMKQKYINSILPERRNEKYRFHEI